MYTNVSDYIMILNALDFNVISYQLNYHLPKVKVGVQYSFRFLSIETIFTNDFE